MAVWGCNHGISTGNHQTASNSLYVRNIVVVGSILIAVVSIIAVVVSILTAVVVSIIIVVSTVSVIVAVVSILIDVVLSIIITRCLDSISVHASP